MEQDELGGIAYSYLKSLPLLFRGKVRDNYAVGDDKLLLVTSDRISAFDVVMAQSIPQKGQILNKMSLFWLDFLKDIVPNHLLDISPESVVLPEEVDQVSGRSVVVKRLTALPFESVVRGYLVGSAYREYQKTGTVCGLSFPGGLPFGYKFEQPIFTPSRKAAVGLHDENISFEEFSAELEEIACNVRRISFSLYQRATEYALSRGIIIADTKFEFGIDCNGVLHLMDEVLTPDSSRFWACEDYKVGAASIPSFDKQLLRDYLEQATVQDTLSGLRIAWNKSDPPPLLPQHIIDSTASRYREAMRRLLP